MRITRQEYEDISVIIKGLLDGKKTRLNGDTFTVYSDSEILIEEEVTGKISKEKEIVKQVTIANGKKKFNQVVKNLLME